MRGTVFNIQPYSLHDGPGIRTIVFLKGCPLHCIWCSNPESQKREAQIYLDTAKCIHSSGCSLCEAVCVQKAVSSGQLDHTRCCQCMECVPICPSKALNVYGKEMSVSEVVDRVEREAAFYSRGEGGLTLSGGEPLTQGDFAVAVLEEAKRRYIHTAMETCGYCDADILRKAANHLDYILFDIKCMDCKKHEKFTGRENTLILENLEMMFSDFPKLHKHIRTPVVPTFNDTEEDILEILSFLDNRDNFTYELLLYHRFGQRKYTLLGKEYPDLPEAVDDEMMNRLNKLVVEGEYA